MRHSGGGGTRAAAAGAALVLVAACAQVPDRPAVAAAEERPFQACRGYAGIEEEVPVIDEARQRLHETVCGAALWFDGLFGEGDLTAARRARGRVEVSAVYSEFEDKAEPRLRFNARVPFPALQNRVSAFVGRDSDEDFIRDRSEGLGLRSQFPQLDEDEEWLAGLGYSLPERYRFKFDFRVGGRGINPTRVFAQARFGYTPYTDETSVVHLRATPFVNNIDGVGFTGSFDVSHALAPTRLLRWGNVGTVTEKTAGVDWRTALILYQNLQALRAIAFEAFVRGATRAPEPLGEYGVRAIYRQPLLERRLFLEVIPGYSWPRIDPALPREGSFGLSLGVEMPFGAT